MIHRIPFAAAAFLLAAALSAQTTLTPSLAFLPGTATAELRCTLIGATPSGVGALFWAPVRSGPIATTWGSLYLLPPTQLAIVPLAPTGTVVVPIPLSMPPFALALQGATFDPGSLAGRLQLTNYGLVAYEPVGVALQDPGVAGAWNDKTKQWCISAVGAPGTTVEVLVYEANGHAISIWSGAIGRNGELNQCGNYAPGLRQGDKIVVKLANQPKIEMK